MSAQPYFASRRIGDATVTVINDGIIAAPLTMVFPPDEAALIRSRGEADADDRWPGHQAVIVVQHGDVTLVIDPAFDDPGSPWERAFAAKWPGIRRTPGLAAALARLGIAPEVVTHVAITHNHDDHFAGIVAGDRPRFPNARHLIGRDDWEGSHRQAETTGDFAERLGRIAALGLLDPVAGDREIAPGLAFLHAPGESPGHSVVRLSSGDQTFYALGDLVHHHAEIERLDWHSPWANGEAMAASRRRLFAAAAAEDATVVFTHETFAPWGRIVAAGDGWRWQRDEA